MRVAEPPVRADGARIALEWRPREPPLLAVAVAAMGTARPAIVSRLRSLVVDVRNTLIGVGSPQVILLISQDDTTSERYLPWADGAVYLGRDERAPSLMLPTALEPTIPVALLERAVLRALRAVEPVAAPPIALIPAGARGALAISAAGARAIDLERLR